jgi:hypothetical protein
MDSLIKDAILSIIPGLKGVEIIDPRTRLEEVVEKRASGDLQPVVIFGFDRIERVKRHKGGSILEAQGVLYLELPAGLSRVKSILQKAASCDVTLHDSIDDENFGRYAIEKIRAFKHTCDNVWMSMKANANSAKKDLQSSKTMPSALKEFGKSRLEELAEEYKKIEPLARRLGIKGAEKVPKRIEEAIHLIDQIVGGKNRNQKVLLAMACAKKMQEVANILSEVKEFK